MAVNLKALLDKTQLLLPNEVENQTCPVCYEDYLHTSSKEFPRKLPCGHLIGTECLLLWASSQTHATSINCPWCMHPIIHPIDRQYIETLISTYIEAALDQLAVQIERAITAVDRGLLEDRERLLSLAVLLALPKLYFDSSFALLPLEFLCACVSMAMKRSLEAHPRHGMLLIALGFCLGTYYDRNLGHDLIRLGKAPFSAAMSDFYSTNTLLVLGVAIIVFLAGMLSKHPAGLMIGYEAVVQFIACLLHYFLARMMR